jgi:hypothetical protein
VLLSDEELLKQAQSLREEAQQILDRKGLLACFDDGMSPTAVGSFATGFLQTTRHRDALAFH